VGFIAGNPEKIGRREEEEQIARIDLVTEGGLDVLVLHEGPHGEDDQPGNVAIRAAVERHHVGLTVCGHVHWPRPLATLPHGTILNVDTRVVILTR
jgi:Icc-related predicted phosphoesterase